MATVAEYLNQFPTTPLPDCHHHLPTIPLPLVHINKLLFKVILSKYSNENPLIYLNGIKYKELNKIIEFIYTGQCEVSTFDLEDFLAIGRVIGVSGIMCDVVSRDSKFNYSENDREESLESYVHMVLLIHL